MKKNITFLTIALSISFIVLFACNAAKVQRQTSVSKSATETTNMCGQTIRYYADKVRGKDGQEHDAHIEMVINPSAKIINLKGEAPNEEKADFDTIIETSDCNLNANLTDGEAMYTGYIQQKDGTNTPTTLKIEASSGGITITGSNPNSDNDNESVIIIINKWEIVHE